MPDHNPTFTTTPRGVCPLGIALHADRKKRHSTRSAFACLRASSIQLSAFSFQSRNADS
jgi:hypothetical protein